MVEDVTAPAAPLPSSIPVYARSGSAVSPSGNAVIEPSVWHLPVRPDLVHRVVVWQEKNARTTLYKGRDRAETQGGGKKPWKQKGTGRARHGSTRSPLWRGGGIAHGPLFRDWSISLPKRIRALGLRVALSAKLRDGRLVVVDSLPAQDAAAAAAAEGDAASAGSAGAGVVKTRDIKAFVTGVLEGVVGFAPKAAVVAARRAATEEATAAASSSEAAAAGTEGGSATAAAAPRHSAQNAQPACTLIDVDISPALLKGCANLSRVRPLPVRGLNVRDIAWAHTVIVTRAGLRAINEVLTPELDRQREYEEVLGALGDAEAAEEAAAAGAP